MIDTIKKLIKDWKVPGYFYVITVIFITLVLLASCQGLFNVNVKDSNSKVVLNDSVKLGGNAK